MIETDLYDREEVEREAETQRNYFNSIFGFACFTIALTCANMPNPQKAAILGLFMVVPMLVEGYRFFPPTIKTVREIAKQTGDEHAKELVRDLDKKYYGFRAFFSRNVMLWSGFVFYGLVLSIPEVSKWITS